MLAVNNKGVYAQEQPRGIFSVTPAILNITLSPGKIFTRDIRITNHLDSPLPMRAELEQIVDGENAEGVSSLAGWTKISESDMIIPARQDKIVRLTISTPSTIPVGGYYGTLFLQPIIPNTARAQQLIQARAAVTLLANVGVPDPSAQAEISNVQLSKNNLSFEVKNLSLYHFSAKPRLVFNPLYGEKKTIEIPEKIILPGKVRVWNEAVKWPRSWFNIYTIQLRVSVGNGVQIAHQIKYAQAPFVEGAAIFLLLGLSLVTYSKRRNVRRALRILFKNND